MKKAAAQDEQKEDEDDDELDLLELPKQTKPQEPTTDSSKNMSKNNNNIPQTNNPKLNALPEGNTALSQNDSSKKNNNNLPGQEHSHGEGEQSGDCARCARIQLQSEEQLKVLEKLTQNNEDLKVKIEALSQILQEKLEAMKHKKTPKKREKTVDPIKKELDEVHLKLSAAQKQAKQISDRLHNNVNFQRITDMKNELIEKQNAIADLQKENKLLEDVTAYNQNVIKEREAEQDTKELDEEAAGIRNMIKDIKKDDRNLDKEMIRYCQHIVALETRHKEVCEKYGVPSTFTPSRFEDMAEIIAENHKAKQLKKDKEEKEYQKKLGNVEINEETYKKFLADVKLKKQEKQEIEINQKRELEDITARVKQVNADRDQLLLKLRDKEKELNISVMKINELKRLTKHNALVPISGQEFSKGIKTSSRRSEVRREQKGISVGGETACSWDNSSELPETKDYSISQITMLYKDEQIKGMSVEYKHRGGDKSIIECFLPQSTEGLDERSLKLLGTEYITQVSGYYNNLFIEYLRIVTSRGNYIMAGSEKNQTKCKKIEFDIKKDEKPISFFGVVDRISLKKRSQAQTKEDQSSASQSQIGNSEDDMILTNIGLELGKRETTGVLRSSALMNNSTQGPLKDEDEEELYGDLSKINKQKGGKRKLIDAAHPRNLNLEDLADLNNKNNNNGDEFKASGVQEEKGTGRDYSPPQQQQQQQQQQPSVQNKK